MTTLTLAPIESRKGAVAHLAVHRLSEITARRWGRGSEVIPLGGGRWRKAPLAPPELVAALEAHAGRPLMVELPARKRGAWIVPARVLHLRREGGRLAVTYERADFARTVHTSISPDELTPHLAGLALAPIDERGGGTLDVAVEQLTSVRPGKGGAGSRVRVPHGPDLETDEPLPALMARLEERAGRPLFFAMDEDAPGERFVADRIFRLWGPAAGGAELQWANLRETDYQRSRRSPAEVAARLDGFVPLLPLPLRGGGVAHVVAGAVLKIAPRPDGDGSRVLLPDGVSLDTPEPPGAVVAELHERAGRALLVGLEGDTGPRFLAARAVDSVEEGRRGTTVVNYGSLDAVGLERVARPVAEVVSALQRGAL